MRSNSRMQIIIPMLTAATLLAASSAVAQRQPQAAKDDAGALPAPEAQAPAQRVPGRVFRSEHHSFRIDTIADGLVHPWSIAFLPDGDMLVTERPGRLRIIRGGRLDPEPIRGVPAVRASSQGGLMEVLLHPSFETNRLVYLSYSKPDPHTTAVARGRFEGDRLVDVTDIFVARTRGSQHFGGKLAFDREGYLFITVGDRQASPSGDLEAHPAQDLSNHQGTIVRLHDDGRVPADNPFVGRPGALPEIWSYGHRNPQGLAVHPQTGDIWSHEHGPQGGDELNLIRPGVNYGWPVIGFGVHYGAGRPIHEATHREGMEQPVHEWTPSIAPSGLLIYTGDRFPAWQGSLFTGGLSAQHRVLSRITLDGRQVAAEELLLPGEYRIRDVRQGPDGLIYIANDHRAGEPTPLIRLRPAGSPPAGADPDRGTR